MLIGWIALSVCVIVAAFLNLKPTETGKCGACGYSVENLASMVCPECGHDFRYYGIQPSTLTFRNAYLAMMLGWGAVGFFGLLQWGVIGPYSSRNDQPVRVVGKWLHDSGLLPAVSFDAEAEGREYDPGQVTLTIEGTDSALRSISIQPDGAGGVVDPCCG